MTKQRKQTPRKPAKPRQHNVITKKCKTKVAKNNCESLKPCIYTVVVGETHENPSAGRAKGTG
jgi:hypothetical protein